MSRHLLNHFVYDRAERGAGPARANGFIRRYDSVEIKEAAGADGFWRLLIGDDLKLFHGRD